MSCVLEQSPFHEGETMLKVRLIIAPAGLLVAGGAYAQSNEFATGNMHFDAKEMDTNGDHMITREEMIAYAEKSWDTMAQGKNTIPITAAAKDFASGGVNFKARAIDTDHDGSSKGVPGYLRGREGHGPAGNPLRRQVVWGGCDEQ